MARARNIKPSLYLDDQLAECSIPARYLFTGLWCIADKEGRLEDRPKKIKAEIYPYDSVNVDKLLDELCRSGHIVRYEIMNSHYIWIPKFVKHQNPHKNEKDSEIPGYEGNREISGNYMSTHVRNYTNQADSLSSDSPILIPDSLSSEGAPKRREKVVAIIFESWKRIRKHPNSVLSKERKQKIEERLKEKRKFCDFLNAFYGIQYSSHHMGRNDRNKVYDDIFTICKNAAMFEEHAARWVKANKAREPIRAEPNHISKQEAVDRGVINKEAADQIKHILGV